MELSRLVFNDILGLNATYFNMPWLEMMLAMRRESPGRLPAPSPGAAGPPRFTIADLLSVSQGAGAHLGGRRHL